VLDASAALSLALEEPAGQRAADILAVVAGSPVRLLAPDLFDVECGSGLVKAVRRGRLEADAARTALADVLRLPAERVSLPGLHLEALDLALELGISAHDAEYVALAALVPGTLVTADARLARALAGSDHQVLLLEEATDE
jgi:predicted nucleic acid-binding protein